MKELNLKIDDPKIADEILRALGLKRILYCEKKRSEYKKGNIIFDLDEVPGLPTYLEIEAPSWEEIRNMLRKLSIPAEKALSIGPKELFDYYGMNLDEIEDLRFPLEAPNFA